MSKEDAKKFLELAEKEEGLKALIEAALSKMGQGVFDEKTLERVFAEEIMPLAREKGLNVSMADLKLNASRKLSDDELEAATGGRIIGSIFEVGLELLSITLKTGGDLLSSTLKTGGDLLSSGGDLLSITLKPGGDLLGSISEFEEG